jgi:hypothetical protein
VKQQSSRIRLSLEVGPDVKDRIERLQQQSHATSVTEVVRRALVLYEELLEIQTEGSRLLVEGKSGRREILRFV